jgi:hypothetical protein
VAKKLAFYVIILVLVAVFGELLWLGTKRIVVHRIGRTELDQAAVLPHPFRTHALNITYGVGTPDEKHNHTHNAQGFKYPVDVPKQKPNGTIRIFALGGSTLYGWGSEGQPRYGNHPHLANDETITYFLEKQLNQWADSARLGIHFQVINAGVPDYNSSHELIYFNEIIYEYEPDMVISIDGNNEMYGFDYFNPLDDYHNTAVNVIHSFNERYTYFTLYTAARFLAQYSDFFNTLQYTMLSDWQKYEEPTLTSAYHVPDSFEGFEASYQRRAENTFMRSYYQFKAAGEYYGFPFIVFLQPQMLLEDPDYLSPADLKTLEHVRTDWRSPPGKVDRAEIMRHIRQLLPQYFAANGIEFHDVAGIGSSAARSRQLYIDYTHVTPTGAEVTAALIFPAVRARLQDLLDGRLKRRIRGPFERAGNN